MEIKDYIEAGRITGRVREDARNTDWVGRTVHEICEEIEGRIKGMGAKCAFPVNTSINEVAAHYTAEPGDGLTVREDDLVKIDLGAQVNGWIADTAVTVNYDPRYDVLVSAAEEALGEAMAQVKDGAKSSDIGRTIEKAIKRHGCKPIMNLSGHSLDQYTIHAGRSIPNVWSLGSFLAVEQVRVRLRTVCDHGPRHGHRPGGQGQEHLCAGVKKDDKGRGCRPVAGVHLGQL